MKLPVENFIKRFMLHVLPKGFKRVRHCGYLANHAKKLLSRCRELLGLNPDLPAITKKSTQELMLQLAGIDITRCPRCKVRAPDIPPKTLGNSIHLGTWVRTKTCPLFGGKKNRGSNRALLLLVLRRSAMEPMRQDSGADYCEKCEPKPVRFLMKP
jgi:hypothetical protein